MKTEKIVNLKRDVLEQAGYTVEDITEELIASAEEKGWLSVNTGRDGRDYLWYYDGDGMEACMCIENEKFITEEEIEKLLACGDD